MTNNKIVAGIHSHGRVVTLTGSLANPIKVPRDGVVVGNPYPKKDKVVSIPMFPAIINTTSITKAEVMLGKTSRNIIVKLEEPEVLEAKTYSRSLCDKTNARKYLAVEVHPNIEINNTKVQAL